jgi:Holliday junction resolvase RusA-like endonuclease
MLAKEFRGRYCDKQQYLQVDVHYIPPDRRVRDIDNYLKCVFDALTHAGVWKDDSQVKRLYVDWSIYPDPHKAGSVCLRIEDLQ